ncbi:MAG: cytochrome c3 family protein [Desulfobacteraceae bacterium]|nr:cytochrome c3 family protein [Desulfobacteraceae bacterium]
MRKRTTFGGLILAAIVCLAAGVLYAGTDVKDEIELNDPNYETHEKGIVVFTHKKHMDDYAKLVPELYENGCGECHHDDQGKPLVLKLGDDVQRCIECHKIPGEMPSPKDKKKKKKKVSKAEKLEYHAEALHYNCRDCHRAYKKKTKSKNAPTTCTKCHPKVAK